jgi:uncharacterized protein YqiB (DUF1249 family)
MKYLEDDNVIVSIRSNVRVLRRKVTGASGVRRTHLMLVPNYVRIQILLVQGTLAREGRRYLLKDARKALQCLEKIKLVYISKVYQKHYSGFPKFLL